MSDGDREYAALADAMDHTAPACADDARFTLDREDLHRQELAHLRTICRVCGLQDLCDAYARTARPRGGLWAGRHYTPKSWSRT